MIPTGQAIYFRTDVIPHYQVIPNRNFQIETFLVNGVEQSEFVGNETGRQYTISADVGYLELFATFIEQPKVPINPIILILLVGLPSITIIWLAYKLFYKKFERKRRLKEAVENYQQNKKQYILWKNNKK